MKGRSTVSLFVIAGLLVALAFAFFVSPYASSEPDGLEKVAADQGFDSTARDHTMADGPLADYVVRGVDDEGLSTGLAGIAGVVLCFAVGTGGLMLVRFARRGSESSAPEVPVPS